MRIPLISTIIDWFRPKKEEETSFIPKKYLQIWWKWFEENQVMKTLVIEIDESYKILQNTIKELDQMNINKAHQILSESNIKNVDHYIHLTKKQINTAQATLYPEIKKVKRDDYTPKELSTTYSKLEEIKTNAMWINSYIRSNQDSLRTYSNFNEKLKEFNKTEYDYKTNKKRDKIWSKGIKESFNVDKKAYYQIANRILNVIKGIEVKYNEIAELLEQYRIDQVKPVLMWSFLFS
jgi:hypothetical protein